MVHLITPMMIGGAPRCYDPELRRTEAVLTGDAKFKRQDGWEVFRATAWGDEMSNPMAESVRARSGKVAFGICCASRVVVRVWGRVEILNTGYDTLEVLLNGVRQFYHESTQVPAASPWTTVAVGPTDITIPLAPRACGNLIEIIGSTVDDIANNDVWWRARILEIA